jgi:diaminobutyrate-2-oxoglutarate transaminase
MVAGRAASGTPAGAVPARAADRRRRQLPERYDVLGVGFGPANLALAIALEEEASDKTIRFVEAQQDPTWQGGMMLAGSNIQNHPCRDLVSLRNPRSRYSFLNYLFENNRLLEHLNLPMEFPLRKEYAQYVRWVTRQLSDHADFGARVRSVSIVERDGEQLYAVAAADGRHWLGRTLVAGPGRTPYVPPPFDTVRSPRMFHLVDYLYRVRELNGPPRSVAVIGGSQSAVELTLDLSKRFPAARVVNYLRSYGLRLKDTSPFSEEGYFPGFTEYYYKVDRSSKSILDNYMRPTNYSSADEDVLHELYALIYEQRLDGDQRVFVQGNSLVTGVRPVADRIGLQVSEVHTGEVLHDEVDLVVLATGFRDLGPRPHQEPYPAVLSGVADRFAFDDDGYLIVNTDYRLEPIDPATPPLYLNGLCESTHGIGDAGSFSLLSLRAAVIVDGLRKAWSLDQARSDSDLHHRGTRAEEPTHVTMVYQGPTLLTSVPGPLSKQYLDRQERRESNARTYPRRLPIAVKRAQGSFLEDVDGNVYIDFLTGAGTLSLGHNHPELVAAVQEQLGLFVHGLDLPTPIKDRFTEAQLGMLPEPMRDRMKLHFCGPTGANGIEAAIKLCKTVTGRSDVVAFQGGFHGSTAGAMAVTGDLGPKARIHGSLPGVHFFPYSYCNRCPLGLERSTCDTNCVGYLERALTDANGGMVRPAAVLLEPVQGEGGVIPATLEFAQRLRAITRSLNIPLIVDEVQTGCGRTGTWFAFEQYGIEPDVVVASKALSGIGLPVAVLIYDRAMDGWAPGAHIGTFRGNQLAFAAGVAAIEVVKRDGILDNVRARGEQLRGHLEGLARRTRWVSEVRGRGLMLGLELADPETGLQASALAREVQAAALRNGLILEVGGRDDCVVRMLPALNVTADVVDAAGVVLATAFAEADETFSAADAVRTAG